MGRRGRGRRGRWLLILRREEGEVGGFCYSVYFYWNTCMCIGVYYL